MGVVWGLGSLAWVVLRSTAACQEWRPTKRSAKARGGPVAGFSGGRGGNPIVAAIPIDLDSDDGLPPLPLNDAGALMAQEMEDGAAYFLSTIEENNMPSALADYVNFG